MSKGGGAKGGAEIRAKNNDPKRIIRDLDNEYKKIHSFKNMQRSIKGKQKMHFIRICKRQRTPQLIISMLGFLGELEANIKLHLVND